MSYFPYFFSNIQGALREILYKKLLTVMLLVACLGEEVFNKSLEFLVLICESFIC